MVSRFLLLMALSVCVSETFELDVAHKSYQAEKDQDVTLEWTLTPKPDSSMQTMNIFCGLYKDQKALVLLEGSTEDSGLYQCEVNTVYGMSLDTCQLTVTGKTLFIVLVLYAAAMIGTEALSLWKPAGVMCEKIKTQMALTWVEMVSRFLLLMALSCCVCETFEVKVAHTSYEAVEGQSVTLEWTFEPKPDISELQSLSIFCDVQMKQKDSPVFQFQEGFEISLTDTEHFVGRVQWDEDLLTKGRVSLEVSPVMAEDSGMYKCEVSSDYGTDWETCSLSVTAPRVPIGSVAQPEAWTRIRLFCGLFLSFVVLF
ncbi:uncharacterized protein LOC122870174 isoform X10 [Xyrichtys novacula]|uniref:Uncharacterized protein LOC122870174 isoform X10 n=1 Tax=Xyrichtys novacula TaxID=13765 RepID=A0AAV1HJI9_XYRNO|nr:uncharacterized protein LOC122870174 isoform X10 [Xyrichtys novacula]